MKTVNLVFVLIMKKQRSMNLTLDFYTFMFNMRHHGHSEGGIQLENTLVQLSKHM